MPQHMLQALRSQLQDALAYVESQLQVDDPL